MILKYQPKDWDIATDATPDQVLKLFPRGGLVGASFGVVNIPLDPGSMLVNSGLNPDHVEVATFRKDGDYTDGRRPDTVEFTTSVEEDSNRRDFTFNALFYDPFKTWNVNPDYPGLLDFHGGLKDLKKGIVRCVGMPYNRFREDYLRMLRAIRFAVRFNFWLDIPVMESLEVHARKIYDVAPERVQGELNGMMATGRFHRALALLDSLGLLKWIIPELGALKGCEQPPEFHPEGDVWTHTMLAMEYLMDGKLAADVVTNLGLLFHDLGKPGTIGYDGKRITFHGHEQFGGVMARVVMRNLRYPNEITADVVWIIENHMRFYRLPEMRIGKARQFMAHRLFDRLMEVCRCDCASSQQDFSSTAEWIAEKRRQYSVESTRNTVPLVNGDVLIRIGMKPGPTFKTILEEALNAQLEGRFTTQDEGIRFVLDFNEGYNKGMLTKVIEP